MDMSKVLLPLVKMTAAVPDETKDMDNQQINPSAILSYLNIRGVGRGEVGETFVERYFNGVPFLMYWDTYKNYYANKQEGIGAAIHGTGFVNIPQDIDNIDYIDGATTTVVPADPTVGYVPLTATGTLKVYYTGTAPNGASIALNTGFGGVMLAETIWSQETAGSDGGGTYILFEGKTTPNDGNWIINWRYATPSDQLTTPPRVAEFSLENIDLMREAILAQTGATHFVIENNTYAPYSWILGKGTDRYYAQLTQEGLGLKTYQSDLFNNWMETEWIDGTNGISAITAIDTTSGSFTIDTLNLSKKVYDMLNRIAISGGTYDDWLDTVYTHDRYTRSETPVYMGGLSRELVFQEVVSNSQAGGDEGNQPLGTLAGKGVMGQKKKGGRVTVKVDEPCYIMGIISLTPRLDYSQGNKWDVNLKTMDDLHKPALDEIGFQDLITEQMAWWDTLVEADGTVVVKSAGKQPAWINYMTNVNQVRGNFAIKDNEMFMTLNRRYEYNETTNQIGDLTTYIDPMKFNHIFAQTSRDAQNFWAQISVDITARRKMSAKIMPNL